jgi:3-hydroxyisobutyrate dehydrogenase-like beta-hydroxyacid dehydrogenase
MDATMSPTIALIGYGEVGRILARDLAPAGVDGIAAYDILFDPQRPACPPPAQAAASAAAAVSGAGIVVSAVTAGSALDAARSVVPGLAAGALFVDMNSVSPGTKRAAAHVIEGAGGRYVEAAVMASVPPHGIRVPILLGGPHAAAAEPVLAALGFSATVYADTIGPASAVKMCRSVVIKGLEALLTESLVAARRYGVDADVLATFAETFPGEDWPKLSAYMIGRAMQHGRRRAEEMREVARTLEEAGIAGDLALATAGRQDRTSAASDGAAPKNLAAILALLADVTPETQP